MRPRVVIHIGGLCLWYFAATFAVPTVVSLTYREWRDAVAFTISGFVVAVVGQLMTRVHRATPGELSRVETLAVVSGTWLLLALAAALPLAAAGLSWIDASFEAMSGLTTTGATVIRDFTGFGHGIFLWRALIQWFGGMGILALFIAILPRFGIAGRQLFFAEAPGPVDEPLAPKIRHTAAALWGVYAGLTAAECLALVMTGMPLFDSACHALATLAAGGFSPHPLSIAGYANPAAEWVITVFMFLAGANFALHYRTLRGERLVLLRDEEFRTYVGIVGVATLLLVVALYPTSASFVEALRLAAFQVLSILTTTGFASVDFELWSNQAKAVLLVLMFVGGCAGSAAGGPKVVRLLMAARYARAELRRTLHPRAVLPVRLGGRVVSDDVMRAVLVFLLLYLMVFAVCAAVVAALGADLMTAITASIACLGNIGPGFQQVGPMANFADLHPVSRVVLTATMWIGRLEVVSVLALLQGEVWKARWRG